MKSRLLMLERKCIGMHIDNETRRAKKKKPLRV